jgi:uncharacterized protein (DUF433 family)
MYVETIGRSARLFVAKNTVSTAHSTIATTASLSSDGWDVAVIHVADPLIAGTRIPIYRVSALLDGGMSVKEVAEDFPSLTEWQIIAARAYAIANPPSRDISYPKQSLKRLLRDSGFVQADADTDERA